MSGTVSLLRRKRVITPRLLLLYNFGIALLFVVIGLFSLFALEPYLNRPTVVPPFDASSHKAIEEEQDIDKLRGRAIFYFEIGRELKQARYSDSDTFLADMRKLSFLIAFAFALGGVFSLFVVKKRPA